MRNWIRPNPTSASFCSRHVLARLGIASLMLGLTLASSQIAAAAQPSDTDEQRSNRVAEILADRASGGDGTETDVNQELSANGPEVAEEEETEEDARRAAVASILSEVSTENEVYTQPQKCISKRTYRNVRVLSERYVAFVGRREVWINELRRNCHGLRKDDALEFDLHNNRVCTHARFESFTLAFGEKYPRAFCTLGDFHAVTPQQLTLIEDALD